TAGTGFDYGIQVHPYNVDLNQLVSAVQGLGVRWVKFQVPWMWIEPQQGQRNWNAYGLEDAVNAFHNAGIKILLSVVAAPKWSRSIQEEAGPPDDFNLYADFVSRLSQHFKGRIRAIEVMNETNLKREWNTGRPLSAAEYVDLLCRAYSNIKAVDPSIIVVSGAPTPTGWNDGIVAIDDVQYLRQMYQAGLKGCSDAVGVHPSGYNNPPDVNWQTYADPTATFGAKGHRSWFFQATISAYHTVMQNNGDGNKRLWATEWGWGSIENLTPSPAAGYEFFQDNTEAEQADFIVKAFQIAKARGYMGVMFLWNLNYAPVCGAECEQSAFGIVRPDWSLRPAYNALANMPK
ncbi:MAG: beta-galactosidase, partial [Anaerolineae bacterium]